MKLIWKQILIGFVLGAVVGAFAGKQWCAPSFSHRPWAGGREHVQEKMLEKFNSKLDLNSDQQQKVAVILQQKRQKIDALRGEMRPKFEEIRNATRSEIRQLLTPEQQTKFDAMVAERDAQRKQFGDHHGGGEGKEE